jgi:hypothetical protein
MNMKRNKNLILLGIVALSFGFSSVASAAYVCEPHAIVGTNHFITSCYNTTPNYVNNSTVGRLGDTTGTGLGAPIAYSYDSGFNTNYNNATNYNNDNYSNTNSGSNPNYVNTTNTSNGVGTNSTSTKTTTVARTNTTSSNKVATNTSTSRADENNTNNTAGTTNVSNNEGSNLSANGLTALSLQGSNSFLPDTVWEWICVFFLILVIVILIRQFKGKPSHDAHHAAPHH